MRVTWQGGLGFGGERRGVWAGGGQLVQWGHESRWAKGGWGGKGEGGGRRLRLGSIQQVRTVQKTKCQGWAC